MCNSPEKAKEFYKKEANRRDGAFPQIRPTILSTASAYGRHYDTDKMLDALIRKRQNDSTFDEEFARKVFQKCGYKKHSVALSNPDDLFRPFKRSEYLQHRQVNLIGLAERAGKAALESWSRPKFEITHLLFGTMTGGMHAPSIDVKLVDRLGLDKDVARLNVEGMGCLTGFRLLNMAKDIAKGDPNARVLVIVGDLRSALGNSLPQQTTRQDIVSVALFRDAASACIVGGISSEEHECPLRNGEKARYEILSSLSRVVNDDHEAVDYFEDDDGSIRLHLSKDLPYMIGKNDKDFVDTLIDRAQSVDSGTPPLLNFASESNFDILCHTGGPKVLLEVQHSLGVEREKLAWSWETMEEHGNLSGASNLAVLDCHNRSELHRSKWALCLSMGPGPCLEGLILKSLHDEPLISTDSVTLRTHSIFNNGIATRKKVHIVGAGLAGLALAAGLDPELFEVKVFESSSIIEEKGYGLAIWPSTMSILKDGLRIEDLDYFSADNMYIRKEGSQTRSIPLNKKGGDKGFMQRRHLLATLKKTVLEKHQDAIFSDYRCARIRFCTDGKEKLVIGTYEHASKIVSHTCDLLIGADGINSVVRKYVALELNKQEFGHLSCYRFLVEEPSSSLLKETTKSWNMSIGDHIHSPCYHVSREKETLSIVVLEYDGTPPSFPRHASREELMTVAKRSKLSFVQKILENEKISDLMCYSTFHIDCKPWHNASAAIIGDSAHAYGPLTAKMANLAINDAWTLSSLLNDGINKGIDQASILSRWENIQRPKFQATRLRTYRHLEMYAPRSRKVFRYLWKSFPLYLQQYFGSIFAYDYEVFDPKKPDILSKVPGVVGISHEDPLIAFCSRGLKKIGVASALGFFIYYTGMENSVSEWYRNIQMKS